MALYLDHVPFSGIIRIRDMMYSVANPYRLDQGDVSFDAPESVKSAMTRAVADNRTHYLQTSGVPQLRELIAEKLRRKNGVAGADAEHVLVTNGGTVIRTPVEDISIRRRGSGGVVVFKMDEGERVVSVARLAETENGDEGDK